LTQGNTTHGCLPPVQCTTAASPWAASTAYAPSRSRWHIPAPSCMLPCLPRRCRGCIQATGTPALAMPFALLRVLSHRPAAHRVTAAPSSPHHLPPRRHISKRSSARLCTAWTRLDRPATPDSAASFAVLRCSKPDALMAKAAAMRACARFSNFLRVYDVMNKLCTYSKKCQRSSCA